VAIDLSPQRRTAAAYRNMSSGSGDRGGRIAFPASHAIHNPAFQRTAGADRKVKVVIRPYDVEKSGWVSV
jgi:hypothetical protein